MDNMSLQKMSCFSVAIFLVATGFNSIDITQIGALGNTLYVGGSGPGNYSTIQNAIDAAGTGDTVFVFSGTYYEHITVNKQLSLIGNNKENTIIDGGGSGCVVIITAEKVNVSNFTIQNGSYSSGNAGIGIFQSNFSCIFDNRITDNDNGINIWESNNNLIFNNTIFLHSKNGIKIYSNSHNNTVLNNTITNNSHSGISITESPDNILIGNFIFSNEFCGIYLFRHCNNTTIKFNTIQEHGYQGIRIFESFKNLIFGNSVINCSDGIVVEYSEDNQIIKNVVESNNYYGINIGKNSNNNTINQNIIRQNGGVGVLIYQSNYCTIFSNNITGNMFGLSFSKSKENRIFHNFINLNNETGIYLFNTTLNNIFNNSLFCNTIGIEIAQYCTNNLIVNNSFTNDGLFISYAYDNTILNNTVNNKPLLYLEDVDQITIAAAVGQIILVNCSNIKITQQNITHSSVAIELLNTCNSSIENNSLSENIDSIMLIDSDGNNISRNTISYDGCDPYNFDGAIEVWGSNNNLSENDISHCKYGIIAGGLKNNIIINNNIYSNSDSGILVLNSFLNEIYGNTIKFNDNAGIELIGDFSFFPLTGNVITKNFISDNVYGIKLLCFTESNSIYDNYFNNIINAFDEGNNSWNISEKTGKNIIGGSIISGNYWHDYVGEDLDEDGIGDTLLPYDCNGHILQGGDWHPLVYYPSPTIVNVDDDYNPSTSGWGYENFSSIQDGIDNVRIGGTVNIFKGIYTENIVIDKPIIIIGEDKFGTLLSPISYKPRITNVLISSDYVNISSVTIENSLVLEEQDSFGIEIVPGFNHVNISHCILKNNDCGIFIVYNNNLTLLDNDFINNGVVMYGSYDNKFINNIVNGKPLVYLENRDNEVVNYAGQVILVQCNNILVENCHISHIDSGIQLLETQNSTITNCSFDNNSVVGINIYQLSNNNLIYDNKILNNDRGLFSFDAANNEIKNNTILNNTNGIDMRYCNLNSLNSNIISNNMYGLNLTACFDNLIYNNYFNNTNNAFDDNINIWNIENSTGPNIVGGPYIGGNYWNDYIGVDLNNDGFGDEEYFVPIGLNGDFLPLMPQGLYITVFCPVDIKVTDPKTRTISKITSTIPDATYKEFDLNFDGELDDQVHIPNPLDGIYLIEVIPEENANDNDMFTIHINNGDQSYYLVKNIRVKDIPNEPYSFNINIYHDNTPLVYLINPSENTIVNETISIKWYAIDTEDNSNLPIYLYLFDSDNDWTPFKDNPYENTGELSWDTTDFADGEYKLLIEASDSDNNLGVDSCHFKIKNHEDPIENHAPNKPTKPQGPTSGKAGEEYTYSTTDSDIDDDLMWFKWDWGDGTYSDWEGPYTTLSLVESSHIWDEEDDYQIRVKAKDEHGLESAWSDPLEIEMPKTHSNPILQLILKMLERFPFLQSFLF